jgi:ABC-type glycerol-3-phosphate transport system substrate-binding protein
LARSWWTRRTIKVNSNETRAALEYFKKLMPFNPPEVYAWDDASNNRWLISGKGAGIMNPPSAWAFRLITEARCAAAARRKTYKC